MAISMKTKYCGFELENPFILASSPISSKAEMICRAFDAGWAGAVTKSISYLQDEVHLSLTPRMLPVNTGGSKALTGMGNIDFVMDKRVDEAFADFAQIKEKYPEKMLIISVKAHFVEKDWKSLALKAKEAGADAIELCLSCIDAEAGVMICQDKKLMTQVIKWVKEAIDLPIVAKLSIHVNDIGDMAACAVEAGASAVTAINSIHGIGALDTDTLVTVPDILGQSAPMGLSGAFIKPIAEHCVYKIALRQKENNFEISGVGGISNGRDALEYLSLGADTIQVCTEVMYKGYGIITPMLKYLNTFMEEHGFESIDEFRGCSPKNMVPAARNLSLKQQLAAIVNVEQCIGCGRCVTSCSDGGKQAIQLDKTAKKAFVDTNKCTGCGLCKIVCPTGAIGMEPVNR